MHQVDKQVCVSCIGDEFLQQITSDLNDPARCSYCLAEHVASMSIEQLATHINPMVRDYYIATPTEPTTLQINVMLDGGPAWKPDGKALTDVIQEEACLTYDVAEDVAQTLRRTWFNTSSNEHLYGEDPHFEPREIDGGHFRRSWILMEQSLKYETRYLSPALGQFLDELFAPLLDDDSSNVDLVVNVGPACDLDRLYRARVFQDGSTLHDALRQPDVSMGPPPASMARTGRMNAVGISVFYGATGAKTAIREVRPPVGCRVVVATFRIIRPLRLLNLLALKNLFLRGSLFDPTSAMKFDRAAFLRELTTKMTRPVMPDKLEEDYLVTQAIADFLSSKAEFALDGIQFPSAQNGLSGSGRHDIPPHPEEADNVILFHKSSRVVAIPPARETEHIMLLDSTEHGDFYDFMIEYNEDDEVSVTSVPSTPPMRSRSIPATDKREPALALEDNSLEVHDIRAVEYTSWPKSVYRY